MLYQVAAEAVAKVRTKQASIKSTVLGGTYKNKKQLYALVCETLKYYPVIEKILTTTGLCKKEPMLKKSELTAVLLYDLLFGKGITGAPKLKNVIERHKTALRAELARLKIKHGVSSNIDLIKGGADSPVIPRYVRVNTLKLSVDEAISYYKKKGHTSLETPTDYKSYVILLLNIKPSCFVRDFHIKELLVFHHKADFHEDKLYRNGSVILQDKASCVPAVILNPAPNSAVIDCCAAPGNKTSQLAALMQGKGEIFAFERNGKRATILQKQLLKAGVSSTKVLHKDFLSVDPLDSEYSDVTAVLVDPSCSGSGIVNRMDGIADGTIEKTDDRMKSLSNFQAKILKHALAIPNVQRLVYSTCSVHREENENVVEDVLEQVKDKFRIVDIDRYYSTRGIGETTVGDMCLRFTPEYDLTNGFFVALFERQTVKSNDCDIVHNVSSKPLHKIKSSKKKSNKKRKTNKT